MRSTLDLKSLWQSTHAWEYVETRAKISQTTYTLQRLAMYELHLYIYLKPWLPYGFI